MKDKLSYLIPTAIVIGLLLIGYFLISGIKTEVKGVCGENIGSVSTGGEYHSTNTKAMNSGAGFVLAEHRVIASTTPLSMVTSTPSYYDYLDQRFTSVTLGSIIISSSTPYKLVIHNATSSTDKASTTVAVFDNNTSDMTAGTYTFDIMLDRGLVLEFEAGFLGAFTITYK